MLGFYLLFTPRNFFDNFTDILKCLGFVVEKSWAFSGHFLDMSRTYPGHFLDIIGKCPVFVGGEKSLNVHGNSPEDISWKLAESFPSCPETFPGHVPQKIRKVLESSRKCLGNVLEHSWYCIGFFVDISRKIPGMFQRIFSGQFWCPGAKLRKNLLAILSFFQ